MVKVHDYTVTLPSSSKSLSVIAIIGYLSLPCICICLHACIILFFSLKQLQVMQEA